MQLICQSFFCKDTATTEIYTYGHTLSLHDSLPIFFFSAALPAGTSISPEAIAASSSPAVSASGRSASDNLPMSCATAIFSAIRSEEHTSELQSLMRISYAVFCLKKNQALARLYLVCTPVY